MSVPDFPTAFNEEALHDWEEYNEGMNNDCEAWDLLEQTETKLAPILSDRRTSLGRFSLDDGFTSDKPDASFRPDTENVKFTGSVESPSSPAIRRGVSFRISDPHGRGVDFRRHVRTIMLASHAKKAAMLVAAGDVSRETGRIRRNQGRVDVVDEVAGLIRTLERPTCVGMLDHQALLVVRIQHSLRAFLARRCIVKANTVRAWYKDALAAPAEESNLRTEQLKLFCRENEIEEED